MEVIGCGCMGFSFTEKYKIAIISLYDMVVELGDIGILDYADLQSRIANKGVSAESEIRMIIPFLVKANVINDKNCIKTSTGSRIRKLVVNNDFFTEEGVQFIKVLKLEINKELSSDEQEKKRIEQLFHDDGMILFMNLCKSNDYIYRELFHFLKMYKTIDKNEFYLLTNLVENNQKEKLDAQIKSYREGNIAEIKIVKNKNDWQYLMRALQQFGIVEINDKKCSLTADANILEVE